MTRDEAKQALKLELEQDENPEKLIVGNFKPADLIAELDKGGPFVELVLTEFVFYSHFAKATFISEEFRNNAVSWMQASILKQEEGFGTSPFIETDSGVLQTPNQVLQQIKEGTDFGNQYAAQWLSDAVIISAAKLMVDNYPRKKSTMTREKAKAQLRIELDRDLSLTEQVQTMHTYGNRSALQIMEEIEQGTFLGNLFLSEFICYNGDVDEETRAHVVSLMQEDILTQSVGWANTACILWYEDGGKLTPNQVLQQIKDNTDDGNRYASEWLLSRIALTLEAERKLTSLSSKVKDFTVN